ncbi:MAG: chemotaxis-specific protein-glutamate methyltransferase CheB [Isosphaeraceae bacterium]|nr:chemotaxis-specific protein-glutamate methyltransferase CheB [Isosphaeraceae bacterium]
MSSPTGFGSAAGGPIDVLIVDDSAVVRQRLKAIVESDTRFRVLLAADPYEAVETLKRIVPGVILLDVEMPRMDGLTFLRKLMKQHPLPVVLCTSVADRAVRALEMGALEVIAKPDWRDPEKMAAWGSNLLESVRNAARAGRLPLKDDRPLAGDPKQSADAIIPRGAYHARAGMNAGERIIAVGVSTGGVQTVHKLLSGFASDSPGTVIAQHMPADFLPAFATRLDQDPKIPLQVHLAKHHDPIKPGNVYVIPGGVHGAVRRTGNGYRVEIMEGPAVNRHWPSVDVLFRSTAQAAGPHAAGVILTGMGADGAAGLLEMREAGALTIAQDEATSIVFGMPREAIKLGAAKFVYSTERISQALMTWAQGADTPSWH